IPPVLHDLTYIEQMLIARVHPVVSMYRRNGRQTAYKGNVINFVQDIGTICNVLPLLPAQLAEFVIITRSTPTGNSQFKVRRQKVVDALNYLKSHHQYYSDITISDENLSQIPENGNMMEVLQQYAINDPSNPEAADEEDSVEDHQFQQSFVPNLLPLDQQRVLRQQFNLPYPTTGAVVNEFETEGYIA